ncbi:MAG: tRNA guanosine(34) transglycosylase Tgt [bacterium]
MKFTITATSGRARCGVIETDHGSVQTPNFMSVGTVGSVKGVETRELLELGAQITLANAYHLYLRPGTEVLEKMGGLHKFMAWDRPILVDSGGFQVFSLSDFRKVKEEGVTFRSHIDGSKHLFTPEKVISIQRFIGADFIMPLDHLVGWPAKEKEADEAAQHTWRWLERGISAFEKSEPLYGHEQTLLPIVQGSFYEPLRRREAERYAALDAKAYAIGGLAVGEEGSLTREAVDIVTSILPEDRFRYSMGVGKPEDLLDQVGRGIDLFDCVVPTRNGRNGTLFTMSGRMNMRNMRWATDDRPVEEGCPCPACTQYSRAYIRHLYVSQELLALKLGSVHNLSFFYRLMGEARNHIMAGDYSSWAARTIERITPLCEE